jgi:SM-20-related protein
MTPLASSLSSPALPLCHASALARGLGDQGWGVRQQALPPSLVAELRADARRLQQQHQFRPAGIGGQAQIMPAMRGDAIVWLDPATASLAQGQYLMLMEELRLAINQELFLGLFDLECHYAAYPAGAGYQRHLDRHRGSDRRLVSIVAYLNENWQPPDGGQLRLYLESGETLDIQPQAGTLACFLSGQIYHEVLPARRERLSIAGWFRRS